MLTLVSILHAGCGGSNPQPPSVPPPTPDGGATDGIELRGGERLGWEQFALDPDELRSYSYVLFVDDATATLGDVRCGDAAGQAGVQCSGLLPVMALGRHELKLATRGQNGLSSPSMPLVVRVVSQGNLTMSSRGASPNIGETSASAACFVPGGNPCYVTQHVTDLEVAPLSIAALPDGRALIAQKGRGIFSLDLTGAASKPALEFDSEILHASIAVDPLFSETRFVYLALTLPGSDGPQVDVVRYREIGGILGEAATLVSGVPAPEAAGVTRLVIGDRGRIYLAMARGGTRESRRAGRRASVILRYEADGTVPRESTAASPVLTPGPSGLSGLAWQASEGRLWLAATEGEGSRLSFLQLAGTSSSERPFERLVDMPLAATGKVAISTPRAGAGMWSGIFLLLSGDLFWTPRADPRGNSPTIWSRLRVGDDLGGEALLGAWDSSLLWVAMRQDRATRPAMAARVMALRQK